MQRPPAMSRWCDEHLQESKAIWRSTALHVWAVNIPCHLEHGFRLRLDLHSHVLTFLFRWYYMHTNTPKLQAKRRQIIAQLPRHAPGLTDGSRFIGFKDGPIKASLWRAIRMFCLLRHSFNAVLTPYRNLQYNLVTFDFTRSLRVVFYEYFCALKINI